MKLASKLLPLTEFIFLLTVMITILAMATDVMLPGLDAIAIDLGVENPNNAQHVVSIFIHRIHNWPAYSRTAI